MGYKMSITVLLLVISALATCAVAETDFFTPYAGTDREIEINQNAAAAITDLNRYHGGGGYSYYPSHHHSSSYYYRPSYPQSYRPSSNLGNIIAPAVFGLSAVTGLAAASSLFPSTSIVGK